MRRRLVLVFWSGAYGGAETYGLSLIPSLRKRGIDPAVLFICRGGPLEVRLREQHIPYELAAVDRGRDLLTRPWRLARALDALAGDAVILPSTGFLVAMTRVAGFWGPIIAVEHGDVLQLATQNPIELLRQRVDRLLGTPFVSGTVAVSEHIREAVEQLPHGSPVTTIRNAVDLDRFVPARHHPPGDPFRIGAAARLVPGKGIDILIRALCTSDLGDSWECLIAGDGPERESLERLARQFDVSGSIRFVGWVDDMVAFWQSCSVAVVPSFQFVESFGMTAVEAMACGVPVVASKNGGLEEVVPDGRCGSLVSPGNVLELATQLRRYALDRTLCRSHGAAARVHCETSFDIRDRADQYIKLLGW